MGFELKKTGCGNQDFTIRVLAKRLDFVICWVQPDFISENIVFK
jgi:hypothetical protein